MDAELAALGFSVDGLNALIRRLLPSWQHDELTNFSYLSGGYSNTNLVFERLGDNGPARYVLRVPQRQQPYVDRLAEVAFYQQLPAQIGLQPVALDAASGLMVTSWVDGTLLVDAYPQQFAEQALLIYLKKLHAGLPKVARTYHVPGLLPDFLSEDQLEFAASKLAPQLRTDLAAEPDGGSQTCHNDLNPWNILVTDKGWITLDWEFAGRNDPLFDLVGLHQGLELDTQSLPELAQQFMPGLPAERLSRVFRHFWLREWAWAKFQLGAGNVRDEIAAQADIAQGKLERPPSF
jgi:aminoglycoside phosphotransferase (APT) family kinase protein